VADPVVAFIDVLEDVQKIDSILVVLEDGLSFVAPGGNMADCTGVFDTKRAGHEPGRAAKRAKCNKRY
jgi:hypothetical protein